MEALLRRNAIEAVVHFSGNAYVGESMAHPEDYYQNITVSTVAILRAMQRAKARPSLPLPLPLPLTLTLSLSLPLPLPLTLRICSRSSLASSQSPSRHLGEG